MTTLPKELTIPAGENQTLVFDQIQSSNIHVKRDANATIIAMLTEAQAETAELNFYLEEEGANLTFLAFIIGTDKQNYKLKTISKHQVPHTNAYYYIRSAMFDQSKIDYYGNLIIDRPAQQTDCYLAHNSLMLSKKAHTDTEPCLEIEADDVTAGHAATVGRVDDTLLFYLMSRGLDRRQAQDLLIKGFMEADLEKIPNEEIRTELAKIIEDKLECLIQS